MLTKFRGLTLAALSVTLWASAGAQSGELPAAQVAALKQKLTQRVPNLPPIEGARTTPMSGLIEIKAGGNVFYTDANGDYLIEGQLIDTKAQRNLTAERMDEINRVDFATLPLKDAVVWKQGNGKRRLAVFADPNCGYCKRLEGEFQQLKDVTVYTFMIPILGGDGKTKIDNIWCSKDRTQAWRDWMLNKVAPTPSQPCPGAPIQRNMDLSQKLHVNGTPAVVFEDGSRLPGYDTAAGLEQRLVKASKAVGG